MTAPSLRLKSWLGISVVALVMLGTGVFVHARIESAIDIATRIARPHELQTRLEHAKSGLDFLEDAVQDYLIDGASGMRTQYDDSVRALGAQVAELSATGSADLSPAQLGEVRERINAVLAGSRAVVDARSRGGIEAARRLSDANLAALRDAQRVLDSLVNAQQDLMQRRQDELRQNVSQLFVGLVSICAIGLAALLGAGFLVELDIRNSHAAVGHLRSENERLDREAGASATAIAEVRRELAWISKRALHIQEQERRSLALELHDQIGQELAALVHTLNKCEREMPRDEGSALKTAIEQSVEIARAAYGDVHNLALDLRPAMLDRFGLVPTLQWYARQQAKYAGCEITVEADAIPLELPSDILISAFRIVQEAVVNATRHAKPRRIAIACRYHDGRVALTIKDNGSGFDPASVANSGQSAFGLGINGMRQRAQDVGGELAVHSKPGAGTQIEATLPLPEGA